MLGAIIYYGDTEIRLPNAAPSIVINLNNSIYTANRAETYIIYCGGYSLHYDIIINNVKLKTKDCNMENNITIKVVETEQLLHAVLTNSTLQQITIQYDEE